MANLKSSLKDIRRIARRTEHNRGLRTRLKTLRKKADAAIASGEATAAQQAIRIYSSALDKAAKTSVIHVNKANRQKSRLVNKLMALSKN